MKPTKHAGGRPPLPPADKRHNWNITLSAAERAAIEAAARAAGQPPRVWARNQLLKGANPMDIELAEARARIAELETALEALRMPHARDECSANWDFNHPPQERGCTCGAAEQNARIDALLQGGYACC